MRKQRKEFSGRDYYFETQQIHAGQEYPDPFTGARAVPIYATASYVFPDSMEAAGRFALEQEGNIYSRLTNPTTQVFEKRMAALEKGAGALAVASGSAAVAYAVQNIATAGSHIIAANNLYGGTCNLFAHTLREQGIETTFVDPLEPGNFADAVRENTKLIFVETISNPNAEITDLEAVAEIAHSNGIPLIVDNTLATPFLVRPIEYGADIVVHSATKFIGGHGTVLGGVIIDSGKFPWCQNDKFPGISQPNASYHGLIFASAAGNQAYITKLRATLLRDQGAALSPFHSFLLLQGLETLSLRVERHVENALKTVEFLKAHPLVERVHHPAAVQGGQAALYRKYFPNGGGSVFTFDIKGTKEHAKIFTENLQLFSLLANVADVKSLVIHPASTTHAQLSPEELKSAGIQENTIRLSIGTEHIRDILEDLSQALEKMK